MQSTQKERLRKFIDYTGLQDQDFAAKMDSSKQELRNWLSGKSMSMAKIKAMLDVYKELNSHWLLTGYGNMLNFDKEGNPIKEIHICSDPFCLSEKAQMKDSLFELQQQIIAAQQRELEWRKKGWILD